jgi:hypothetical protein
MTLQWDPIAARAITLQPSREERAIGREGHCGHGRKNTRAFLAESCIWANIASFDLFLAIQSNSTLRLYNVGGALGQGYAVTTIGLANNNLSGDVSPDVGLLTYVSTFRAIPSWTGPFQSR